MFCPVTKRSEKADSRRIAIEFAAAVAAVRSDQYSVREKTKWRFIIVVVVLIAFCFVLLGQSAFLKKKMNYLNFCLSMAFYFYISNRAAQASTYSFFMCLFSISFCSMEHRSTRQFVDITASRSGWHLRTSIIIVRVRFCFSYETKYRICFCQWWSWRARQEALSIV